jgi:UDP-N-acetylmuramoyl-tripeptide--D-alanyl-D-alanine ligase
VNSLYFAIFFVPYLALLWVWYKRLDKPLVKTMRIKRYFVLLLSISILWAVLIYLYDNSIKIGVIIPLFITFFISNLIEMIIFFRYKSLAKEKLKSYQNLKIVAISASFGKTSIKNYLFQLLSSKYNVYMTPRSINTIAGIVKDINQDLPNNLDIYIAEAGARQSGDIAQISALLEQQYAILGVVGKQHIEYFKTLDNIIYTKMEILQSPNLTKAWVHNSVPIKDYDNIEKFPNNLNIISSTLDGIEFELEIDKKLQRFKAPILGKFNAINLTSVILCAKEMGFTLEEIQTQIMKLKPVEHRLQKIVVNDKIILDDSFNGNLEGMLEAIELVSTYDKGKLIVTPGLVEADDELNTILAKRIDEVFDRVVLTGSLNIDILDKNISKATKIILKDKSLLQETLSQISYSDDIVLFANDAPNFI